MKIARPQKFHLLIKQMNRINLYPLRRWFDFHALQAEYAEALDNLKKHDYKVDYIITHAAPENLMCQFHPQHDDERELNLFLQGIMDTVEYRHWYFAHLQEDRIMNDTHRALYQDVLPLDGNFER